MYTGAHAACRREDVGIGSSRSNQSKRRQQRAAARRLPPLRGEAGRRLQHRSATPGRVVGVGRFAEGMHRRAASAPPSSVRAKLLWVLPLVVGVVWVAARLLHHV
ncbi:MAG TPA: hypothetical protein VMV14_07055 [Acidimicrobiales bacterium]|nr:hypothetical protein [Acidimicrobiales bacterium]